MERRRHRYDVSLRSDVASETRDGAGDLVDFGEDLREIRGFMKNKVRVVEWEGGKGRGWLDSPHTLGTLLSDNQE